MITTPKAIIKIVTSDNLEPFCPDSVAESLDRSGSGVGVGSGEGEGSGEGVGVDLMQT